MDKVSKKVRSYTMSQVKSKNTSPELVVRSFLHRNGYRYSLHNKSLPGSPDIVLRKYKTVIFINGCFWHGHPHCPRAKLPESNKAYRLPKLERNKTNDKKNYKLLKKLGRKIIIIRECQLKKTVIDNTLKKLLLKL